MFEYKIAYWLRQGTVYAEVLEFPEATAFGATVSDARAAVIDALRCAPERRLRCSEILPSSQPGRSPAGPDFVEAILVLPYADNRVEVQQHA
jgi:predicted RNase H-like HicB family nuclease